jgi:predicted Ser/Thr protein kinase
MDSERWRRVQDIFGNALAREARDRAAFIEAACAGDAALQAEVESLLGAHDRAGTFLETAACSHDSGWLPGDGADRRGEMVGPYRIERELGRGGMGIVYLAEDTRLGRRVALKALPAPFTADDQRRERLRREARAAAGLSHPGIATAYSLDEIEGQLYLAYEYVAGHSLRAVLDRGALPPHELLDVTLQIAQALAAAHAQGIVHRDLKPENIMRTPEGRVKILDFGLARVESGIRAMPARLTSDGMLLGTPAYMAPEQLQGRDVDFRADLFAFGVVLYELACGIHPFANHDPASTIARILQAEPVDLTVRAAAVPEALARIARCCLRKDPADRYAATAELVRDLEKAIRTTRQPQTASQAAMSGGDRPRLSPRWWWQFHQIAVAAVYTLMLYPAWRLREWLPAPWGLTVFFALLAATVIAVNLRLHLWFTSVYDPSGLTRQRARLSPWVRRTDWTLALLLLGAGLAIATRRAALATLFITVAVSVAVAFLIIEPATTRAAFRRGGRPRGNARAEPGPSRRRGRARSRPSDHNQAEPRP